jgi:hypothetical protein
MASHNTLENVLFGILMGSFALSALKVLVYDPIRDRIRTKRLEKRLEKFTVRICLNCYISRPREEWNTVSGGVYPWTCDVCQQEKSKLI